MPKKQVRSRKRKRTHSGPVSRAPASRAIATPHRSRSPSRTYPDFLVISIAVLVVLLLIGAFLYVRTNPLDVSQGTTQKRTFDIPDKCTQFVGNLLHTVNDAQECEMRCVTQCEGSGGRIASSSFELRQGCNSCSCSCR